MVRLKELKCGQVWMYSAKDRSQIAVYAVLQDLDQDGLVEIVTLHSDMSAYTNARYAYSSAGLDLQMDWTRLL